MDSRLILSCKNLGYYHNKRMALSSLREWDIRGLNLKFFSYDRVRFFFNSDEQKTVLLRLFLQKLKPKTGSIIIPSNIHIYFEKDLWMRTDKDSSLINNLESKLFSNRPWFGGKRKDLNSLIDRLDLGGYSKHLPINKLPTEKKKRLRILMMIAARTKVIIVDKLFAEMDEISFFFVLEWLRNFPGILILFGDSHLPVKADKHRRVLNEDKARNVFNKTILFSADGIAKKI